MLVVNVHEYVFQGETGGPGQKGSKGDKGEGVSIYPYFVISNEYDMNFHQRYVTLYLCILSHRVLQGRPGAKDLLDSQVQQYVIIVVCVTQCVKDCLEFCVRLQSSTDVSLRVWMESQGPGDSKECTAQKEMKVHVVLKGRLDQQGCRYRICHIHLFFQTVTLKVKQNKTNKIKVGFMGKQ